LLRLTEEQLEKLEERHRSYVVQRKTFLGIPSMSSVLGLFENEVYCTYLRDKVSKYLVCSECDITVCPIKQGEIQSHS
jgi:hypothetical protein